jgi:ketosteroid isomerase-like protein
MKKLMIIQLVFLLAFHSNGQNNNSGVEAEIREWEKKEHTAMLNQDALTLQQIWAADFMVNAPFNRVTMGSQEVIDLVKKGVISYSSFTRNIEQIMVKGDMVITMGSEEVVPKGNIPGAGKTVHRRYTNIWTKQNNTWKLTARHANEIPKNE